MVEGRQHLMNRERALALIDSIRVVVGIACDRVDPRETDALLQLIRSAAREAEVLLTGEHQA